MFSLKKVFTLSISFFFISSLSLENIRGLAPSRSINNPHILEKEQNKQQTKHQNISEQTLPLATESRQDSTVYSMIDQFSNRVSENNLNLIWMCNHKGKLRRIRIIIISFFLLLPINIITALIYPVYLYFLYFQKKQQFLHKTLLLLFAPVLLPVIIIIGIPSSIFFHIFFHISYSVEFIKNGKIPLESEKFNDDTISDPDFASIAYIVASIRRSFRLDVKVIESFEMMKQDPIYIEFKSVIHTIESFRRDLESDLKIIRFLLSSQQYDALIKNLFLEEWIQEIFLQPFIIRNINSLEKKDQKQISQFLLIPIYQEMINTIILNTFNDKKKISSKNKIFRAKLIKTNIKMNLKNNTQKFNQKNTNITPAIEFIEKRINIFNKVLLWLNKHKELTNFLQMDLDKIDKNFVDTFKVEGVPIHFLDMIAYSIKINPELFKKRIDDYKESLTLLKRNA